MSFGAHEYQHRFYRQVPHKKPALYTPLNNSVLPLISELQHYPSESYQSSVTPSPALNHKTIQEYQWHSPQRVRTEPTSQLQQQYKINSAVLDHFRKEAEEYKHNVRFRHLRKDSHQFDRYRSFQNKNSDNDQPETKTLIYNPQVLVPACYDSSTIDRLQRQRMYLLQRENNESKYKLKDYKRKYSKLKEKLKKELEEKRKEEIKRTIEKQKEEVQKEKHRLAQIRKMMSSISDNLNKNSELLNESIKIQRDLKKKSSLSYPKNPSHTLLEPEQTLTEYDQDYSPPHSPPTVIYTKKSIDTQYGQMQKIKKDIDNVKYRLKKLSK